MNGLCEPLEQLKALPEGWHGCGKAVPDSLLEQVDLWLGDLPRGMKPDEIKATYNGGVLLRWEHKPRKVEIDFEPIITRKVTVLTLEGYGDSAVKKIHVLEAADVSELRGYIAWTKE